MFHCHADISVWSSLILTVYYCLSAKPEPLIELFSVLVTVRPSWSRSEWLFKNFIGSVLERTRVPSVYIYIHLRRKQGCDAGAPPREENCGFSWERVHKLTLVPPESTVCGHCRTWCWLCFTSGSVTAVEVCHAAAHSDSSSLSRPACLPGSRSITDPAGCTELYLGRTFFRFCKENMLFSLQGGESELLIFMHY